MGLSQKEMQNARNAERRSEMNEAIADGKLVIRQMTPAERKDSDARKLQHIPTKGKGRQKQYAPDHA